MKKILFITNYPSPYRVAFFNEFGKDERVELDVVFIEGVNEQTHRSPKWFDENYTYFTAHFLHERISLPGKKRVYKDIKRFISQNYDEIVFGGYAHPTMMYAMLYMRHKKIPYSIEIDGGFVSNDSRIKYQIKKLFISSASRWYSSGEFSDKYLIKYGADPDGIFHYPFSSLSENDIDTFISFEDFEKRKTNLRQELGIVEDKVLMSVGQFIWRKGFDVLLKAMTLLPSTIGAYIIGGTPTDEYLNYVKEHHLSNVHFVDFQVKETLIKYYRASDVFVLATREDIWGLVVNEALSNGIPVVTTDKCIAGIELITSSKTGYIVPVDDYQSLAKMTNQVLSQDSYSMREAALETARHYTIEKMAQRHVEIILGEDYE